MKMFRCFPLCYLAGSLLFAPGASAYENFEVAVYCRAYEVEKMSDRTWLEETWAKISDQLHIDKVYLETHRDLLIVDDATLESAKAFFAEKGIRTGGGITYTIDEPNRFETFSFSNPEHRAKVREIAEHTARHFDHFILDDFFFTSTKSHWDVQAKGQRSWTQYRLDVMTRAAEDLVIQPSKAVNPDVKIIIKYPNWYDHFAALGFNLETGPNQFDGIYAGTETRDAVTSAQHLQPYLSYNIIRYFENLAPGRNLGGWVDIFGSRYADRYAEQLWLTLMAKAPEITLFQLDLLSRPITPDMRGDWQDQPTSLDFDTLQSAAGDVPASFATIAGQTFQTLDSLINELGTPFGLKSYKPHHSVGEAFLQNFLGIAGFPMEMVPEFPKTEPVVLLTAQAADDPTILSKITEHLSEGKKVIITSGLLQQLQHRGLHHIAEIEHSGRIALADRYVVGRRLVQGGQSILIPQITYRTNDSWELVSAIRGDNGWPLLHDADYLDGQLYVLTIPENFADFYHIAPEALNAMRAILTDHLPFQLEGPAKISLLIYDNDTFIVNSFLNEPTDVAVCMNLDAESVHDLLSEQLLPLETRLRASRWDQEPTPHKKIVQFRIPPHSFRAFRVNRQ